MQKNSSANRIKVSVVPISGWERTKDLRRRVTISINLSHRLGATPNMLVPQHGVIQLPLPFARNGQLSLPFEEVTDGTDQD
jgi:hypothetical protein